MARVDRQPTPATAAPASQGKTRHPRTIEGVIAATAEHFKCSVEELYYKPGENRHGPAGHRRQVACHIAVRRISLSLDEMGTALGVAAHTVNAASRAIAELLRDPLAQEKLTTEINGILALLAEKAE